MLLAAEDIGASGRCNWGSPSVLATSAAQAWAEELAGLAPLSVAGHKLLLSRMEFSGSADAAGAEAYARVKSSSDAVEVNNALGERRAPQFQGR